MSDASAQGIAAQNPGLSANSDAIFLLMNVYIYLNLLIVLKLMRVIFEKLSFIMK